MCIGVAFSGHLHVLLLDQMPLHVSTGLQVAAEGWWAFVFFHKHILATARRSHFAVKRCSRRMLFSECVPHARAGFVQSHLAALGSGLLQAPLFGFLAFFFTVVTQNVRRALVQSVALSATLCKFAHAPLVPANFHICCHPAGLGVRLFP